MARKKSTIVIKFGGTSVASRDAILSIVRIVRGAEKPVVVVSAVRGVTELLLSIFRARNRKEIGTLIERIREMHEKLINELLSKEARSEVMGYLEARLEELLRFARTCGSSAADSDKLVSYGEIISSFLISRVLRQHGVPADQIIATDLIVTDDNFGGAEFIPKETLQRTKKVLKKYIGRGIVPVITGFIGETKSGRITTLGRGGSDYSASIIGYVLGSKEIQIWTDVDGIYTADPRVVKNARIIEDISYREASEMAAFGAKVLHPRTIRPAVEKNIPVRVLNTFNLGAKGTLVSPRSTGTGLKAIAFKKNVVLVNVYSDAMLFSRGFLARMFEIFARHQISIDLVSVSEVSVSVTLDSNGTLDTAVKELETFSKVSVHTDSFGVISLIGEGIVSTRDIIMDVSAQFSKHRIPLRMISMGASDINISLVIPAADVVRAANMVHDSFLRI